MNTQADSDSDGIFGSEIGCHFVDGLLAIRPESLDAGQASLGQAGFQGVENASDRVLDRLAALPEQAEVARAPIGLLSLQEDPHRAAAHLAHLETPIEASPIHGLGYESHSRFMSGAGPERDGALEGWSDVPETTGWIAVVDSGIVAKSDRPDWMGDKYVTNETPIDIETLGDDGTSHGTFVASLMRMVAPEIGVAMAAAPPDSSFERDSSHLLRATPPTNELDVLGAIGRLVRRLRDDPASVHALNLSLGAPRCGYSDSFLLTLRSALDLWRSYFGVNAPIFAAGGNSDDPGPVYPAAFESVRGVAAGLAGEQKVWVNESPQPAKSRTWIDDVAPGVKLYGLGGLRKDDVVWWSGSSFASAVAAASFAKGETYEVENGVVYWPDRQITYGDVDGLQF